MKNYIVLDLETPNRYNNSMCSIGIVIVENNHVQDEIYSLINPEAQFDQFNINFTGIKPEDVENKPTFKEFWDENSGLLTENIIVGQNITFDLNVISKALTRYNLPIPPFKYYCTLRSCQRNLNLYDNSLSYIVNNVLNTTYNAHNAMADAIMTQKLYDYLEEYEERRKYVQSYYYRPNIKRDFDRTLDLNFNYLYGLLEKFNYITQINENYYKLIETWYEANKDCQNHPLIQNILLKTRFILENELNPKQMKTIIQSLKSIKRSPEYKASKLKLEILRGLLDSIICEGTVQDNDEEYLEQWIEENKINDKRYKQFIKDFYNKDEELLTILTDYSRILRD